MAGGIGLLSHFKTFVLLLSLNIPCTNKGHCKSGYWIYIFWDTQCKCCFWFRLVKILTWVQKRKLKFHWRSIDPHRIFTMQKTNFNLENIHEVHSTHLNSKLISAKHYSRLHEFYLTHCCIICPSNRDVKNSLWSTSEFLLSFFPETHLAQHQWRQISPPTVF